MKKGSINDRRFKRYSGVPLKLKLKKEGAYHFVEMIDVSIGGFMVSTNIQFDIYDIFETKLEFPLTDGKDLVYAKSMVWRIEPDPANFNQKRRFVAFKFTDIHDYDKTVINDFLTRFEEEKAAV